MVIFVYACVSVFYRTKFTKAAAYNYNRNYDTSFIVYEVNLIFFFSTANIISRHLYPILLSAEYIIHIMHYFVDFKRNNGS